jgi:hypothetical protein
MPLIEARLAAKLKAAFDSEASKLDDTDDPLVVRDRICKALAKAVVEEVRQAQILVTGMSGQYPFVQASATIT